MTDFVRVLHGQSDRAPVSQCPGTTALGDYCDEQQSGLETTVVLQNQKPRVEPNMTDKINKQMNE